MEEPSGRGGSLYQGRTDNQLMLRVQNRTTETPFTDFIDKSKLYKIMKYTHFT